jgi:poly-gamma-glutamate biosynthesis protein PgsC/CapC
MTGLTPEVSALLIALGLVLALACYLVTNLSPGGMITPGWLALCLIVQPMLAIAIGVVIVLTFAISRALQEVVILYGKRLFATVVLIALFFQLTLFLFFVNTSSLFFDVTTLGFIVPGLVAYQLLRQPPLATLAATVTVTMVAYAVMLAGILLRLVPIEGRTAAGGIAAEPSTAFSSLHLTLSGIGIVLALGMLGIYARRVRVSHPFAPELGEPLGIAVPTIDERDRHPPLAAQAAPEANTLT